MSDTPYVPSPYRILVVDDVKLDVQDLIRELGKLKLEVAYAPGADTAAEMLKKEPCHGAILDKYMPNLKGVMDEDAGIELSRYMLKNHPDVYCLILTSTASARTIKETEDLENMFDYLDKGMFTPREIAKKVSEMMSARVVQLMTSTGMNVSVDRMYFYGKSGTVIKAVTRKTGAEAGVVEIENERWLATTRDTKGFQTIAHIPVDTTVRAYGISSGAIQVSAIDY